MRCKKLKFVRSVATVFAVACTLAFLLQRFYKLRGTGSEPNQCLTPAYDYICLAERNKTVIDDYLRCRGNPEKWTAEQVRRTEPTREVLRARELVAVSDIISVGSAKSTVQGFCDQISKERTVCTDRQELDLVKFVSWAQLFGVSGTPPRVLFAEHVLEHFTPQQVVQIAAAAFISLKPGGVFRIAVPDGYKPSPSYQQYTRAGSTPSNSGASHMASYTMDNLFPIFLSVGFKVRPQEYFNVSGEFVSSKDAYAHDEVLGRVSRSWRHDSRNARNISLPWNSSLALGVLLDDLDQGEPVYTSLWFDAVKPFSCPSAFTKL